MLTEAKIKNATTGMKPRKMYDHGGLYIEIRPKSKKTGKPSAKYWRFRYNYDGKAKLLSMGVYPGVSLIEARQRRGEAQKLLAAGIDPSAARKAEKALDTEKEFNTFEIVGREWFALKSQSWARTHSSKVISRLEKYVFPDLGKKPIDDITAPLLLRVIRKIEHRGIIETAHRTLQHCSHVFRYAIITGRAERDPAIDLKGALTTPGQKKHFAAVTDPDRVGDLLRQLDGYQGTSVVQLALKLAPLVFVRPGELRHAQWENIDLEAKQWEFTTSKTHTPLIVPLSTQAVAILESAHRLTGTGKYIFPSARSPRGDRPMSDNAILSAMRTLGIPKETMSGHGFRAMARTMLDEVLGYRVDYIEHQLAHAVKDPNGRAYNRTTYLPERRTMMQAWADYLDRLKNGSEVAQFHQKGTNENGYRKGDLHQGGAP